MWFQTDMSCSRLYLIAMWIHIWIFTSETKKREKPIVFSLACGVWTRLLRFGSFFLGGCAFSGRPICFGVCGCFRGPWCKSTRVWRLQPSCMAWQLHLDRPGQPLGCCHMLMLTCTVCTIQIMYVYVCIVYTDTVYQCISYSYILIDHLQDTTQWWNTYNSHSCQWTCEIYILTLTISDRIFGLQEWLEKRFTKFGGETWCSQPLSIYEACLGIPKL